MKISEKLLKIGKNNQLECQPMQFHISQLLVPLQESPLIVTKSQIGEK